MSEVPAPAVLQALTVAAPAAVHDTLAELLTTAGALAISSVDAGDEPVLEPAPGATPLWPQVCLTAYFPAGMDLAPLRALLALRGLVAPAPAAVPQRDWVTATQRVPARRYGQHLWVAPPGTAGLPPDAGTVWLTPGLGFGTGAHPSTALCLEWLDAHPPRGLRVLDYGCGSGILALAAARLGAAQVQAVDLDPQACLAAAQNAAANDLASRVRVGPPDSAQGPVDLILANILLPVLVALAPTLSALLRPAGRLLLSGVLTGQRDALIAAYAPAVTVRPLRTREEWWVLEGERVGS